MYVYHDLCTYKDVHIMYTYKDILEIGDGRIPFLNKIQR